MGGGERRGLIRESIDAGEGLAILRNVHLQKERPLPVIQASGGATVLMGMDGFVVGAQELVDGELWLRPRQNAKSRLSGVYQLGALLVMGGGHVWWSREESRR